MNEVSKLNSRKFWVAIGSMLSIILAELFGLDMSPEAIAGLIVMASSYVFAQGLVDKWVVTAQVKASSDVGRIQVEMYAKTLEEELKQLISDSVVEPSGPVGVPDTNPYS